MCDLMYASYKALLKAEQGYGRIHPVSLLGYYYAIYLMLFLGSSFLTPHGRSPHRGGMEQAAA